MDMYDGRMTNPPSETMIRAWVRLQRAGQEVLSGIEVALKAAGLPPLSWYDVLLELERAGGDGLRPVDLERRVLLPQYSISRLIDRIETQGYLERRPCKADGRGQLVAVTKSGRALRARMWPVYAGAIDKGIASRLTAGETATVERLLGKLQEPCEPKRPFENSPT